MASSVHQKRQWLSKSFKKYKSKEDLKLLSLELFPNNAKITLEVKSMFGSVNFKYNQARSFLEDKICMHVGKKKTSKELISYISFIELFNVMLNTKDMKWHTFQLKNPKYVISCTKDCMALKNVISVDLSLDYVSSVEQFVQKLKCGGYRVSLRIVTFKASNPKVNSYKNDKAIVNATPTYIIYYSNEPFIYSNQYEIDPNIIHSIQQALITTEITSMDLTSTDLESLRKLAFNVVTKKVDPSKNQDKIDTSIIFNDLTVSSNIPVHTKNLGILKLNTTLRIKGPNILKGLDELKRQGHVMSPLPKWLANLPYGSKNTITIDRLYRDECQDNIENTPNNSMNTSKK